MPTVSTYRVEGSGSVVIALYTGLTCVVLVAVLMLAAGGSLSVVGGALLVAVVVVATRESLRASRDVVPAAAPRINKRDIVGPPLELLADIQARFDYARDQVRRIPTGIDWSDVARDVDVMLWEAATHAGELTPLQAGIHELRYVEPGTPQAAYRHDLVQRAADHERIMTAVQYEAEDLAKRAGNAAATAHLALVRTGDLRRLEVVTPSVESMRAAGALAFAKERLDALASAWTELDPGGPAQAEQLAHEAESLKRTRRGP